MLVVLFFQCMAALLNPVHRIGEGIKWGLVFHTVAMFSLATVYTTILLHGQSICSIDNRNFFDPNGVLSPGPMGYQSSIWSGPLGVTLTVVFLLNNWLADGLLVSYLIDAVPTRPPHLTPGRPPGLPLLHNLLQEPLGHCLPLPRVLCFFRCVFELSTNGWQYFGLMSRMQR